jgi:hypothetical protein
VGVMQAAGGQVPQWYEQQQRSQTHLPLLRQPSCASTARLSISSNPFRAFLDQRKCAGLLTAHLLVARGRSLAAWCLAPAASGCKHLPRPFMQMHACCADRRCPWAVTPTTPRSPRTCSSSRTTCARASSRAGGAGAEPAACCHAWPAKSAWADRGQPTCVHR